MSLLTPAQQARVEVLYRELEQQLARPGNDEHLQALIEGLAAIAKTPTVPRP